MSGEDFQNQSGSSVPIDSICSEDDLGIFSI